MNGGPTYGATKKACDTLDRTGGLDGSGHMLMVPF
jgi:hypothetical protein